MDVFEDEVLIARDKTKLLPGGPSTGGGIDTVRSTSYQVIAWEVYICVLVLLHANRSGRKFYKSVSEPLKK